MPTLEEALLTAKGRVMVNLDKAYPIFDEIFPILEKTGTVEQIIMKGSKPVAEVKRIWEIFRPDHIYANRTFGSTGSYAANR